MHQKTLIDSVKNAIREIARNDSERKELYSNSMIDGPHEFLFFIKPEITIHKNFDQIIDMIFNKFSEFNLSIKKIILLTAPYLKRYEIIAQHYGIINALSRNAKVNLSQKSIEAFKTAYNEEPGNCTIYGSIEFLRAYPELSPVALDYLWQNSPTVKLGGGAYCQQLRIDGKTIYLVNGFHPRQLEHYTSDGKSIVVFTLSGDLAWKKARNAFVGKTNPFEAEIGSIRRTLLENKEEYNIASVNSSWNGVHLSAGPVESLVELIRYNSDFESQKLLEPSEFNFGKLLTEIFDRPIVQQILGNAIVSYNGKDESIFDLTEEKNYDETLALLKQIFSNR